MIIEIEGKKFNTNYDANVAYSKSHSLCDCQGCKNFYAQSEKELPKLKNILDQFGIDITKPDEISWCGIAFGELDYIFVSYTVSGEILETGGYDIDIVDNGRALTIVADDRYIPSGRDDGNYFTLTVYNIHLPYILSEPLPDDPKFEKLRLMFPPQLKRKAKKF